MKFKSNRKKRSTRKTRQCKRNKNRRTRRQRGGLTKEDVFDNVITEYASCMDNTLINTYFGTCDNFLKLLKYKTLPDLRRIVCNEQLTDAAIRTSEFLFTTKQEVHRLHIQKIETNWPDFVVHLKNAVEAQFKTPIKAVAAVATRPLSTAVAARPSSTAVAARPSSTAAQKSADTLREVAPIGWTQVGNIWQGPNGAWAEQDRYNPRPAATGDELAARLAALKDD